MYRSPDGKITSTCTIITPALREWARTVARVELEAEKHAKEDPTLWRKARAEAHRRFKSSIDQTTVEVSHDVQLSEPVFATREPE